MEPVGPLRTLRDNTFRSLRHRDYRLYFLGQFVSFTGSWIQNAALMWLVFERTRDPLWPPLLLVAQVGPTLLFGPFGGALADRVAKRTLVLWTQAAFLANAFILAGSTVLGIADPGLWVAVQLVSGLIQAVDLPARLSFVPNLVPRADLINAVALNSLLFNSARAFGPAIAGGVFLAVDSVAPADSLGLRPVALGSAACFLVNVISFAAVLLALAKIGERGEATSKAGGDSVWDGLRYVTARPKLALLLATTGTLCIFAWPAASLFPAYTHLVLGLAEKEYSLLASSLGAGALIGALGTAAAGNESRRGILLSLGAGLTVLGLLGLSLAGRLLLAMPAAGCLGCGLILFLSTGQSTMQLSASDSARGRVMALWAMTLSASAPLGHLLGGLAAQSFWIGDVFLGLACGAGIVSAAVMAVTLGKGWKVT